MDFTPDDVELQTNALDVLYKEVDKINYTHRFVGVYWTERNVVEDASAYQLVQEVNEAIDRYKERENLD